MDESSNVFSGVYHDLIEEYKPYVRGCVVGMGLLGSAIALELSNSKLLNAEIIYGITVSEVMAGTGILLGAGSCAVVLASNFKELGKYELERQNNK